jgi:hypothetical protein
MTPWLSGRPLAAEAFNSYMHQRGAAILQASAFLNDERMATYFRVAGVAYLLVDKTDPDTKPDMQAKLRGIFPEVFENENMALLGVGNPLGFGFLAKDFLQTGTDGPETAIAAIGGAEHNLAMIQTSGLAVDEPGLRGKVIEGRIAAFESKAQGSLRTRRTRRRLQADTKTHQLQLAAKPQFLLRALRVLCG